MNRQKTLGRAIGSHQAGRLAEAASLYRDVLMAEPQNANALHLLGVLMQQIGQPQTAVELIARAVGISQFHAPYHLSLGNALLASQDQEGAVRSFRKTIACDPCCLDAHINLGNISLSKQLYQEASGHYERGLACDSTRSDTLVLLGMACIENGETERGDQALDSALKIEPGNAIAHMLRGHARMKSGDYAAALAFFLDAVRFGPLRDDAHNHLGAGYEALGRYAEAGEAFGKALALKPSSAEYLFNVGLNMARRKNKEGIVYLERAIGLEPQHVEAHTTLGEVLLTFGERKRGWREYEWRCRKPEFAARRRPFPQPLWEGQALEGRTILLHAEQGYGDTIQFARFVPEVVRRGGRVVLEVQEGLYRLMDGMPGVMECLRQGIDSLPDFDFHCPLMTLPLALGTVLSVPPPVRIPSVASGRRLSHSGLLKVGLVWGGNPKHARDRFRSITLQALSPLREVSGMVFTNLQKVVAEEDRAGVHAFPMEFSVMPEDDFFRTAAIVDGLDLLISVDTAVAHLAGSMRKPVWLLLPEVADWRWGLEGDSTEWYPEMSLFRQTSEGNWDEVVGRVMNRLTALMQSRAA